MSRAATGDVVVVKPTNNVYTVLALIGVLVNLIGFVLLLMQYWNVFGKNSNMFAQ